jgi:hypothetical protein
MSIALQDRPAVAFKTRSRPYLLDCPFCGRAPKMSSAGGKTKIECLSEGCKAQAVVIASAPAEAAAVWNRRR